MDAEPTRLDLDETVTRIVADARTVLDQNERLASYQDVQALKRRIREHIERLIAASLSSRSRAAAVDELGCSSHVDPLLLGDATGPGSRAG